MPSKRTVLVLVATLGIGFFAGWQVGRCGRSSDARPAALSEIDRQAYAVSFIYFPADRFDASRKARKLAWLAYDALVGGADFAAVARSRSKNATAADGGFFGFVPAWNDTAFGGALQVLQPGKISPPVMAGAGWRIVKRHTFVEARRLEQAYRVPAHGVFIPWDGQPGSPEGRSKEAAHKLALEARDRLAGGQWTLKKVAQRYGRDRQPAVDAWVDYLADRPASHKAYVALRKAKTGGIVGPIESDLGWAVLVRGRYLRSLCRHILIQYAGSREADARQTRTREQAQALARKVLGEVLAKPGDWTTLVKRYSDDPRTRSTNGTMGVMWPGSIPDGFQSVIYDLTPGTIAKRVIETPFGFHILWKVN